MVKVDNVRQWEMFSALPSPLHPGEIADNPLNNRPIGGFPHPVTHGTPLADMVVCGATT